MAAFHENKDVSLLLQNLTEVCSTTTSQGRKLELYKHAQLGKILVIDSEIQHIEAFQSFYHEHVVHLPMCFIKQPISALILGGGSLYAAFELLKYRTILSIDMIDFDKTVIEVMCEYYDHAALVVSQARLSINYLSLEEFIYCTNKKYDFIINDAIDFSVNMKHYSKVYSLLTSQGVCSDLIYRNIYEARENLRTIKFMRENSNLALSLLAIPEYPGFLHLLTISGKSQSINQQLKHSVNINHREWLASKNLPTQIFNPQNLPFYLYLPPYLKKYVD